MPVREEVVIGRAACAAAAAGLLFGWLAWRSRSVASGMLAHAMVNGSVYLLIAVLLLQSVN